MEEREQRDVRLVAEEMTRRFGAGAAAKTESWSHINQHAGDIEAARFWGAVARAIQALPGGE